MFSGVDRIPKISKCRYCFDFSNRRKRGPEVSQGISIVQQVNILPLQDEIFEKGS